jgi:hypothetical protein
MFNVIDLWVPLVLLGAIVLAAIFLAAVAKNAMAA